eukprot:UN04697
MYWSLTKAGVQRYEAEDVKKGYESIEHGSELDTDLDKHSIAVETTLELGMSYLLWVAVDPDGSGELNLLRTNVVHVPAPCPSFIPNLANATSDCGEGVETWTATCIEGYDGGEAEFLLHR